MNRLILPDSGPLGDITNPKIKSDVKQWIIFFRENSIFFKVAAIIDYELRRNYLLEESLKRISKKNISNLNKYRQTKQYLELTLQHLDEAAYLWSLMRKSGQPSGHGLDKDVIFASQALSQIKDFEQVVIVTTNSDDFKFYTRYGLYVWDWEQALLDCRCNEINFCHSPD
jgi:hypothetical protein